jgi:polyphosphate kinase
VSIVAIAADDDRLEQPIPLFDRELSWLAFNARVLGEARNAAVPLLERVKFLAICASNLDEFVMIRPGQVRGQLVKLGLMHKTMRDLLAQMYACWSGELEPALAQHSIRIERTAALTDEDRDAVHEFFARDVEQILTPMAVDPKHPFPLIANRALHLALDLRSALGHPHVVIVRIPDLSPRLVPAARAGTYVRLEDLLCSQIARFFPGLHFRASMAFRVIRHSELLLEDDVQDLLKSIETELRRRERREVVWMEVEAGADANLYALLAEQLGVKEGVFVAPGPLRLSDLMQLHAEVDEPALKDAAFVPRLPPRLESHDDLFSIIRRGDVLLHRPYESFDAVIELLQQAADDPDVVAIKQTLYRTDPGSQIVDALARASESGKQVTAVVELQARFDEKKNIGWARHLEEAGVQVVHGLAGVKTHCKLCLIVRREGDELRRYVHLSTGNYNAATARVYTDLDLFTCDPAFGADAAQLMNLLTGFSTAMVTTGRPELQWQRFIVAPMAYHRWVLQAIERETSYGPAGRITAKMNALADPSVIEALYRAADAGVTVDLLVRGICRLVPRANITVSSVVDRFLEHPRIFDFAHGGTYISTGDWMPRNFFRRFEVTFPILDPALRARVVHEILAISRADDVKAWVLDADGCYRRRVPEGKGVRSQEVFMGGARHL